MTHVIRIHTQDGTRTAVANDGEILLSALSRAGAVVSAPCGGRGRCGKCAVRAEGNFEIMPSEDSKPLEPGYTLSCRARVRGDADVYLTESETSILAGGRVSEFETDGEAGYGVAVDIGTTTVAAYLLNLKTGKTEALRTMLNPQRGHGADVISRLTYAMESPENARLLQKEILRAIHEMTTDMLMERGIAQSVVGRAFVGNTVMMHLAGGYPVRSLAAAPFTPYYVKAHNAALDGTSALLGGCISGYVGADTVAAALACDLDRAEETSLLIDIGTNGEIVLTHKGRFVSCSCAAGPAFEGAHIACGTGAVRGAIDHARMEDGKIAFSTIQNAEATGICGSGLIDLIALLADEGEISPVGRMTEDVYLTDRVYLARADIREVQLAKSAIASGISILIEVMGIRAEDVQRVYVAGGFGNYINIENACKIGMLPKQFMGKIEFVGNAAGDGAKRMLLSASMRARAEEIREKTEYIELASHPSFADLYADNLIFGDDEL